MYRGGVGEALGNLSVGMTCIAKACNSTKNEGRY